MFRESFEYPFLYSLFLTNNRDICHCRESCTLDQREVIVLTRDRMLQVLTHAMHSLRSVKVVMCVNPELKSTYLHAAF